MTDETQGESPLADAPLLPVEQVADSSTAEAETPVEQKTDDAGPARDEDGKFLSANAQKRIDKLTWEKNREREEAQYWREQAQRQQPQEVQKPVEVKPLKLEDFQYDEAAYYAAVNEQSRAIARQEAIAALKEEREAEQARTKAQTFQTRAQEFAKSKPDFAEIASDKYLPVNPTMAEVIRDSEIGPELLYWIGQNREAAAAIYDLPPHLSARELGRIEARLEAQKESAKRPPPQVSKAPPPPPQVETSGVEVDKDPETMSMNEWLKWREKQIKRRK